MAKDTISYEQAFGLEPAAPTQQRKTSDTISYEDAFGLPPQEPTLASRVKQGASRAVDSARTALTDDPNKIAQIAAEQSRNALPQSAAQRQMAEEFAPYVDAANKAEGVVDNVKAWGAAGFKRAGQLLSNPGEAAKMVAEQLPNSIPALAAGFAGAKAGAALGTAVAPGVGTAVGGVLGGIAGGFAGGYGLEKGAAMQEQVQKEAQARNLDLQNETEVAKMVAEKLPEFDSAAQRKGVGTAGTDAVLNVATMGLAGMGGRTLAKEARTLAEAVKAGTVSAADAATDLARLEAANAARNTLKAKALRGTGVVGAEMAGGGASEAVGQKLAYGKVDAGEVIDESLMGLGTGGAMALGSKAFNKAAGIVDQDATTQNLAAARDGLAALGPAFTTAPGAADPNAPQTPPAAPPEAPDLTTAPGAGVAKDGLEFTREVDTSGLSLQDPAEIERAKAATVDYQPGDTTPQWDTQLGATGQRQGLDMPAPEIDTTGLGLDPIRQMVKQAADAGGALSAAAGVALDVAASNAQFIGATGREMQLRPTGPGVTDESNVIDVQGRVIEDLTIGTPRRLTDEQGGTNSRAMTGSRGATAAPAATPALPAPTNLREGIARVRAQKQEAANAKTAQTRAPAAAYLPRPASAPALEAAGLSLPTNQPTTQGTTDATQADQALQASPQSAQAGQAPAAGPAIGRTSTPATVGAPEVRALTDGTPTENTGAQAAPASGAQEQATAPAQTRLGRNNTPLSEGGKPFKTRKAAGDAKKLQPMMRVVQVEGGYALAEKTPAQLAAEERASKRLRTPRTSPRGEPVPAHAFIAAGGGLHLRHRNDLGVDGNPRIGNRRLFGGLNKGLSIEQATEMLVAEGYLSEGASHNDAYALIKKSLTQPQYNADGIERIAEAESMAQFEDFMAAHDEGVAEGDMDPFGMADEFTTEELDEVGYTTADPQLQAEVSALIAQSEAMGIDTYAILEDIARTYADATQDQYNAAARDALAAAIARGNQDGGSPAAQAAPASESSAEQGLNQPEAPANQAQAATENVAPEALELTALSPVQAAAQQDAQEQAAKAEAAAKRAEDAAAKAEDERKRIAQASVRAADTFELGQDPLDSLTGQGSIFDAPEPATAPVAAPAPQPITRADVEAAQQKAAAAIGERIDAMKAGDVNKIAKRFLPTMGVTPTVSKERNKAAMTDAAKVNLMAAADEVGAKLPADVRRALDAEIQGKVADAGQDDGVNPRVPRENRAQAKPIEQVEQKEPWQMTAMEFGQQERGNPHWNQSYAGKDDGAYLADVQATHARLVQEAVDAGLVDATERPAATKQEADEQQARADNRKKVKQGAAEASPIGDAGEKIGGARKDRWKERGLNLDDLDAMTEAEGAELATKANVWKPDYEAMAEASEPVTAAMVKTIYDQLAAKPKKNTPEGRRQYVQMMRIVRDVLTEAKGPEAVRNAYQAIRQRAGLNTLDPQAKTAARELLFSVYKGRSDPFVLGYTELSKAKKMAEDGFPAKADPWKLAGTIKTKETDKGVAMFSQNLLSPAESGPKPTLDQIQRFVDKLQQVAKDVLPISVVASPSDVPGLKVPTGTKPSGALVGGRIYLFADNLKSTGDAYVTLFHEIFHLGLQRVIPAEDYATLLKQFANNPLVAKYVRQWKASAEGVEKAAKMPSAAYEALATEEGMAMIAEHLSANGGIGARNLPGLAKKMLSWFAQVAEKLGFPANFSNWMRDLTRTDAERFVSDMTRAVLSGPKNLARAKAKYGTMAKEMTAQDRLRAPGEADQTQTENFKRWFKDSKVVGAEGKPLASRSSLVAARKSAMLEGRMNGGSSNAKSIADLLVSQAFSLKGLGGLEIPAQRKVLNGVLSLGDDFKVLRSVVDLVPVDVVNILAGKNLAPEALFRDEAMLKQLLSADRDGSVSTAIDIADALVVAVAGVAAKGSAIASNPFAGTQKVGSAADTGDADVLHDAILNQTIGNNGNFDPYNADIRFRSAASSSQPAAWDAPVQTGFDDVIYKLQDKNIDLKRVVESITKSAGQVSDSINAYLKEELFHKRAAKRVADFGARELAPLMNQMRLAGLSMEDVEEYLHARHAKEANAVIAQRNPDSPGLQDGGSGMTNAAADSYFAKLDPAQRKKLEAVATKVDAIIAGTRQLYVDYGLEDQAVVDGWAGMYQHYIPLMREDKDGGMGTGQGFSVKGKETKGRTGSTRKVVDILANVASQRERLIVRGEKNRVTQALVGLAQANPNPDFWEVRSQAPTERVFDPKSGVVVDRPDPLFKSRDNVVVAKVKDASGNVTEQMVVFNEDNPRAVRMAAAMKNLDAGNLEGLLGVSAKITRYFAAINTQYNPVFGVVNLIRDVQGAMINLAATPLAGQQGKIAKDTVSALRGIYSDIRKTRRGGQATSQWAALWEQMQDDGGTTGYRELFTTSADRANNLKNILNPEAWMDNKWGKFFTANGQLKVPMSIAQKGATEIFGWLSDYNEAMENGVRLAAYKAALDKGMSRDQAASIAKNLTVNFNRKGQVGQQAGAVYAFFNAAMQGTARIGQTLFDMDGGDVSTLRLSKTGKAVVYGGVTLGAIQAMALAGAGFDAEDPPEFVRERSLIIPTGGKTYVTIPMPLGLHVIPGIGRHAVEFALSGFDKPAQRAVSVVGMFADAFNPIGNAGLSMQTIAPTALDPLAALTENKDWTGKPIARTSFNKAEPGHTQWKDTATGFSKVVAEAINWVSGGNEYVAGALSPTPDQIDYLLAQLGGGVARELAKVQQTVTTAASGEELPTYKVPLVGRFVGNAASQASQGSAFYANLNRLNELETEIKGLRKDGRFDEAAKLARENPESMMIAMANRAERDVQKLRREKRELIAKDASREEVRAKEEQITAVMTRLNEAAERRKALATQQG